MILNTAALLTFTKYYIMIPNVVKRNTLYEDESISNQPVLFLTDKYSQDFQSVFGHHNKTSSECQTVWNQIRPDICRA